MTASRASKQTQVDKTEKSSTQADCQNLGNVLPVTYHALQRVSIGGLMHVK